MLFASNPDTSVKYHPNQPARYVVSLGNVLVGWSVWALRYTANLSYLCLGQFCIRTSLPVYIAPFRDGILSVVRLCAQKQMAGVYARWVVAMMAHLQFTRLAQKSESIRQPVCK